MRLFTPSLKPTFRRQAGELFEADDLTFQTPSAELSAHLEALEKTPEFVEYPLNRWYFGSIYAIRELLMQRAVIGLFQAFAILLSVVCMQRILAAHNSWQTIVALTAVIFSCEFAKHIAGYMDRMRGANIMRGVQSYLMGLVNRKLLHIDPKGNQDFTRGNLKTLVSSDVESIEDFISAASHTWIPTFLMLIVLTPVVLMNLGWSGAFGIGMALAQIPITMVFSKYIAKLQIVAQDEKDNLTTILGEWVKNIRLVRFLGLQPHFDKEIKHSVDRYTGKAALLHTLNCILWGTSHNWWMFSLAAVLIGADIMSLPIELSSFLPSCWALLYMMGNFAHIPYSISLYAQAAASAKRLREFFECPELTRYIDYTPRNSTDSLGTPVRLHIRNLNFGYDERLILKDFNLTLDLHKRTAIMGEVGSGKTTLLELICGEIHPTSGTIEVQFSSGVTAQLWSIDCYKSFRSQLAYSPQAPYLSNAKLHQNISLAETSDKEELTRAIDLAQLAPDIAILRHGVDEEVGETGINLSGGQKQRVSMGRAFYSKRPLFVLDDPLSAVDRHTELKLMKDILQSAQGLILVSHRLEELHTCDRLIVLENGQIVEDDAPDTLINNRNSRVNVYLSAIASHREDHHE